jgi:hypothetical protein
MLLRYQKAIHKAVQRFGRANGQRKTALRSTQAILSQLCIPNPPSQRPPHAGRPQHLSSRTTPSATRPLSAYSIPFRVVKWEGVFVGAPPTPPFTNHLGMLYKAPLPPPALSLIRGPNTCTIPKACGDKVYVWRGGAPWTTRLRLGDGSNNVAKPLI